VKQAIERAIQEMLAPAIERATKIAVTTSEQIVKKVHFFNITIYITFTCNGKLTFPFGVSVISKIFL